jgi:predicted ATP-dependent serine protease
VLYEPDAYSHEDDDERINAGWRAHVASRKTEPAVVDPEPGQIFEDESLKTKPLFLTARMILDQEEPNDEFIKTGIEVIDKKMRGLKLGGVSLLSGLRGGSKSTLLSQIILSAIDQNQTVIAYSGELKAKQFLRWMLLQAAGKANTKKSTKWENVYYTESTTNEKIAEWMGERFWLYENDYGNEFLKLYAALERQIAQSGANLIVLDNLMTMDIRELDSSNKYNAQTAFIQKLVTLAQSTNAHIIFVAHPRKAQGFLRLDDISGSADLSNAVDNAFIVHRNNEDFKRLTAQMFQWHEDNPVYKGTNVIEVAKNRDDGVQDLFVPLWYEPESKRLKNSESEMIAYGWEPDELDELGEIPY